MSQENKARYTFYKLLRLLLLYGMDKSKLYMICKVRFV